MFACQKVKTGSKILNGENYIYDVSDQILWSFSRYFYGFYLLEVCRHFQQLHRQRF